MFTFDHMLLFIVQTECRNGNSIKNNHRKIGLLSSQSQLPSAENSDLLMLRTVKLMAALELLIEKNFPLFLRSYFLQSPAGSGRHNLIPHRSFICTSAGQEFQQKPKERWQDLPQRARSV